MTISITAEAFEALAATVSANREADARPDGKGGFSITLPRDVPTGSRRYAVLARATAM